MDATICFPRAVQVRADSQWLLFIIHGHCIVLLQEIGIGRLRPLTKMQPRALLTGNGAWVHAAANTAIVSLKGEGVSGVNLEFSS